MSAENSVRETAKLTKIFEKSVAIPNGSQYSVLLLAEADGDNVTVLETTQLNLRQLTRHLRRGGSVFITTKGAPTQ